MTDDEEWRRRFLERLDAGRHPHRELMKAIAEKHLDQLKDSLGDDPISAADRELLLSSHDFSIQ